MWDCNHFKKRRSTISISIYMFEKGRMPGAGQLVSGECREQRTNTIDEPKSTSDTGVQDLFAGKEGLVSRTPPVPPPGLRSSHRVQDSARHMDRASSRSSPHHINTASVQQFSEQEPTRKSLAGSERTPKALRKRSRPMAVSIRLVLPKSIPYLRRAGYSRKTPHAREE